MLAGFSVLEIDGKSPCLNTADRRPVTVISVDNLMRLPLSCMQCLEEFGKSTEELYVVEFRDDGRYEMKCSFGHETTTLLQQQKFEILFEIGANAILDGYYREAVSSFASSMERFYELSIRVFVEIERESDQLFKKLWKTVSKQSERQLGAFIFLWGLEFGESPELLSNRWVEFRNEVIHKGKIPTRDEAVEYGDAVLSLVRAKVMTLQESYSDQVRKVTLYHLRDSRASEDDGRKVSTMSIKTILSLSIGGNAQNEKSLEEHLGELKGRRNEEGTDRTL